MFDNITCLKRKSILRGQYTFSRDKAVQFYRGWIKDKSGFKPKLP